MKNTMIKKINVVVSLWLIVIMATLFVIGFQVELNGFYIAGAVVATILLGSNVYTVVSGLISVRPSAVETEREYNKF